MADHDDDLKPRVSAGPQRNDATHQAILDAAEELLAEGGVAAVTYEAVARRARAGKPTLYRWWPNKFQLLVEVYDRRKKARLADVDTGSLTGDLTVFLAALWAFWREGSGETFAAMIVAAQSSDDARAALNGYFDGELRSPLSSIIERARARGDIAATLPARRVREAVFALCWFRLLTGRLDDRDIPDVVSTIVAGLAAQSD
jgi:AcrR family transcriptional regulator